MLRCTSSREVLVIRRDSISCWPIRLVRRLVNWLVATFNCTNQQLTPIFAWRRFHDLVQLAAGSARAISSQRGRVYSSGVTWECHEHPTWLPPPPWPFRSLILHRCFRIKHSSQGNPHGQAVGPLYLHHSPLLWPSRWSASSSFSSPPPSWPGVFLPHLQHQHHHIVTPNRDPTTCQTGTIVLREQHMQ